MDASALSQALNSNITSSTQSAAAGKQLSQTFDTFLKLLTSQLKNQDPLKPMDSSEFTQQLVSYSQVEQQINTNTNLETLISAMQSNQFAGAVNYIGTTIEALGDTAEIEDGGGASWSYELQNTAKTVALTVTDATGKTVATRVGETGVGAHSFAWDGKNAQGTQLPDGLYTLTVTAVDADGNTVDSILSISGKVEGVETVDGVQRLLVGSQSIPMANVNKVRQAAAN